jgi:hypothetical protein
MIAQSSISTLSRMSIGQWIAFTTKFAEPQSVERGPVAISPASGVTQAIKVSYVPKAFSKEEQAQRHESIFFESNDRWFALHLFRREVDPKGAELDRVLEEILLSVRAGPE